MLVPTEIISTEPATGAVLWKGPAGDVDAELAHARAAWPDWAARPLTVRVERVRRFTNVVRARAEELADLIARETGKPLWEARLEVEAVTARVEQAITAYAERSAQRKLDGALGARSAVRHKPHGVLGVITPYTSPAAIPNGHIVPALIAGNTVVLKPSEHSVATARFLVDCYVAAGIPDGAVRLLVGNAEQGKALAAHPQLDGLLFTGSARAGLALHRLFAEAPHKLLALELGGNNPIVAWDLTDIYSAAALMVQSAFLSSGQRCTAARRLIVQDGAHEPLLEQLLKITSRLIIGAPHDKPAPFAGAMIDNDAADAVQEQFLELLMKGGRPLKHMDRPVPDRPFLSPGIIDVTALANRPDAEIFGPVLQVVRVPDFAAALKEANATRYGLAAALIGGSPNLYDRFWANMRAGIVNWNRPTISDVPKAPIGGVGFSGNLRAGGYYAADNCAYPVVSSEVEQARASIGIGLQDG
jgi:succinylglutamic semialdehyde dehydrogenase